MSTENAPAVSNGLLPTQLEFQMFQVIAKNAQMSGLYTGTGGEAQIFMVLLAARELGISPMIALNGGIWNIKGRIEISARLMNAMIRRKGHILTIKGDNKSCTIIGKRCDTGETAEETFTWEMAETAGLVKPNRDGSPGVWQKYPEDMLYNRCISRLARRLFSDVIGTAYVEGETREIDPEDLKPSFYEELKKSETSINHQIKNETPRLIEEHIVDVNKMITINKDQIQELAILCQGVPENLKENIKKTFEITMINQIKVEDFEKVKNAIIQIKKLNNIG